MAEGRIRIEPGAKDNEIRRAVESADVVQFDSPLSAAALDALRASLKEHPDTELYVYGVGFGGDVDFLKRFSFLRHLSLGIWDLRSLDIVGDLRELRRLSLTGMRHKPNLEPLRALEFLEHLTLPGPVSDPGALRELQMLRQLWMPATQPLVDAIAGHPALERLTLHFGTATDLSPLSSITKLRDLSIWQIKGLTSDRLAPVGQLPQLEAFRLGAARNVTSLALLEGAARPLRYIELEKVSGLESLAPLGALSELRALCMFESRPSDRSLAALTTLYQLKDLTIGDLYPAHEVEELLASLPNSRFQIRQRGTPPRLSEEPSRIGWRGLFHYVDRVRSTEPC